ncbi:hypothetical protein [Tenacibaculum aiptasiae]|uniref:hypothetical protein n=1 Tax=Tenacibaculum aiptasiae TaxID=426481 RepID=UPI0015880E14|nr:hypothetical protein [Tenacibaculum aiptasiae]
MRKSILSLGKALNKAEQKNVNGGISCFEVPCEEQQLGHTFTPWLCINGTCIAG